MKWQYTEGRHFGWSMTRQKETAFKEASVVKKYFYRKANQCLPSDAQTKYLAAPFGVNDDSEIPLTVEMGKYSIERKAFPVRWYVASTDIGSQMKPQSSDEDEEGMVLGNS